MWILGSTIKKKKRLTREDYNLKHLLYHLSAIFLATAFSLVVRQVDRVLMTQIYLAVLDQAKFQNIEEGVHSVQVGWVLVETSELFVVFSKCPKKWYAKLYNRLKSKEHWF